MTPSCETLRERLALEAGSPRPWSRGVEEHVAGCPACAAHGAGVLAATRSVAGLRRRPAPAELAARVTFATDANALGLRGAAHVAGLRRLPAPPALDGGV